MHDSPLLQHVAGSIAGRWTAAASGRAMPVRNPATGAVLAAVPDMAGAETAAACDAAEAARRRDSTVDERRGWLLRVADLMAVNKSDLARIITLENGKPLREAEAEVDYAAGFFRVFAGHLDKLAPHPLPEKVRGLTWTVHHRPAGVAALITPWNFPLAMLAKKLPAALAAGCGVVVKPAEATPLSAIATFALLEQAGIPAGLANLVIGRPQPIGQMFCTHPAVRLISFTGSTEVGRMLIEKTAPHVKRLSLELGGNAPFLVFDDADLAAAADGLMMSKFRAGGQTCVCANRVLVQKSIVEPFARLVAERVAKLRVGDGADPATDVGPLINREGFSKVAGHVGDALASGAVRLVGMDPAAPADEWGCFYPPTVLTGIRPQMRMFREETFGPVVAIAAFDDEAQAVELANATDFGLAGYVFTADARRAERIVAQLRFGYVGVNTGSGPVPDAPFGGMKQSGFGREGGVEGLLEFCETQTVASA